MGVQKAPRGRPEQQFGDGLMEILTTPQYGEESRTDSEGNLEKRLRTR